MIDVVDVLVVGGGPVGLKVSQIAAESGLDTLVIEDERAIGKPVQCAGLVSQKVIEMTSTESSIAEPKRAKIYPPEGDPLIIESKEKRVSVIDRTRFDKEMASKAMDAGADIKLNSKFTGLDGGGKVTYIHNGEKRSIPTDMIVGADGPSSAVRRSTGLPGPNEIIPAIQAIIPRKTRDVKIYLGDDVAPGFFAWQVPFSSGSLIGLASTDGNTYDHLIELLRSKGLESKIVGILSGSIPIGLTIPMVKDGVLLVGDAAGQVKPLSGGGIYTGLKAAKICGETIVQSIEENDFSQDFLMRYQERFIKGVGKEIKRGIKIRKIFKGMRDEDMNKFITSLKKENVKKIIEQKGDIDHPSKLVKPIVKASPGMIKFIGPVLKSLF